MLCGTETLELLKPLVAPAQMWTVGYDWLIETMTEHYKPKPLKLHRRLDFYARERWPQKLANEFLVALHKLASKCEFQELDQMLLDQFTRGAE